MRLNRVAMTTQSIVNAQTDAVPNQRSKVKLVSKNKHGSGWSFLLNSVFKGVVHPKMSPVTAVQLVRQLQVSFLLVSTKTVRVLLISPRSRR